MTESDFNVTESALEQGTERAEHFVRSPLLLPAWSTSGRYEVFDARRRRKFRVDALSFQILTALGTPLGADRLSAEVSVEPGAVSEILSQLRELGLVTEADGNRPESVLDWWTPAEFAVQQQAALGGIRDRFSGPSPAAIKKPDATPQIALPEHDPHDAPSRPLAAVLRRRRSVRSFTDEDLQMGLLSLVLERSARIDKVIQGHRGELTMRPYPSAGARHSLEIYLFCARVEGVAPGVYHYDPEGHGLSRLRDASSPVFGEFMETTAGHLGMARAEFPVAFYITSVFGRVLWKYKATALLSVYRDAGCLLQTLYLTATDLGLAGCAVAGQDDGTVATWLGHDPAEEGHVGGFVLGAQRQRRGEAG